MDYLFIAYFDTVFPHNRRWLSEMARRLELIPEEEWNLMHKMSTERIKGKLTKAGYDKDSIAAIKDRPELLEMLVECELDKRVMEEERKRLEEQEEQARKEWEEERKQLEEKEEREWQLKAKELELKKLGDRKEGKRTSGRTAHAGG